MKIKTPYSALSFLKYVLRTSHFKIEAIQTTTEGSACGNNSIEFIYRYINTSKINIFDEYCLKNKQDIFL